MARKNVKTETPGAPAADLPPADAPADDPAQLDDDGNAMSPPVVDTPESVAAKDAELKRRLEDTKDNVGSSKALNWDHLNSAAAVAKDYSPVDAGLPDQVDVDPDKLSAPVLTKQGWVLPTNDPRARIGSR